MKHRGISGVSRVGHFVTLPQISPQALSCLAVLETKTLTTVMVGIARSIPTGPNRMAPPRRHNLDTPASLFHRPDRPGSKCTPASVR
jgi:hypothetical protein